MRNFKTTKAAVPALAAMAFCNALHAEPAQALSLNHYPPVLFLEKDHIDRLENFVRQMGIQSSQFSSRGLAEMCFRRTIYVTAPVPNQREAKIRNNPFEFPADQSQATALGQCFVPFVEEQIRRLSR